jgi:hypothetical protein
MTVYWIFQMCVRTYNGTRSATELISVGLPFLILALFFYILQRKRLKFLELPIAISENDLDEAVKKAGETLGLKFLIWEGKIIQAVRPNPQGKFTELITLLKDGDTLLINSIGYPENNSGGISFYTRNRINVRILLANLNETFDSKKAANKE